MPSSKRETEEDMLEELCSLAKKDARITIPEICGRMEMTRREVLAYLKQLSARGYVKTEENKSYVRLTELGRIRGEECRHRHETFTQFLEYVGVNSETAKKTPAAWNMWQAKRLCSRSIISSTTEAPLSVS